MLRQSMFPAGGARRVEAQASKDAVIDWNRAAKRSPHAAPSGAGAVGQFSISPRTGPESRLRGF